MMMALLNVFEEMHQKFQQLTELMSWGCEIWFSQQ
jgi:hypothetical protein